ncbi:MAG: type II toxin-antitoxin system VapB family antitoxin [Leptospiraceae bacterium]|nr:type II toxin-antitoxin system VapB family antitoxin [Leptospiraceae bacterium]MCP5513772.1 type II toxin-antitoxin system VapB family antitoxin [Leptospiraceae bacterium]
MKTTLNLNEELLNQARELSGIKEKTALLHAGLLELISKYSRERLIQLSGTEKQVKPIRRRKA